VCAIPVMTGMWATRVGVALSTHWQAQWRPLTEAGTRLAPDDRPRELECDSEWPARLAAGRGRRMRALRFSTRTMAMIVLASSSEQSPRGPAAQVPDGAATINLNEPLPLLPMDPQCRPTGLPTRARRRGSRCPGPHEGRVLVPVHGGQS
jgi:hypothetical protein